MRQFDVIATPERGPGAPLVVILQHDSIDQKGSVVVARCIPATMGPRGRGLAPQVDLDGRAYVVLVGELAAIERDALSGKLIANLAPHRGALIAALDLLFTGI